MAALVSVVLLGGTLVLIGLGFFITPWDHHVSVTDHFHIGVWGFRLVIFNNKDYGPYRGSIIAIVDDEGNEYPPRIRESAWGDAWGAYWRYFRWKPGTWGSSDPVLWTLMMSLWYPVVLFSILPCAWWYCRWHRKGIERLRDDRLKRGLCPQCEYNLTGNVSGICPECGDTI